ncbi:MAG TPA: hypothetical protein PKN95_06075 [Verrucomicrobiota bacterium]|nr:hypothetical protein [Verrucomicrobiota bacterium]HNT15466.1 hypothetical protein [Verrucomicrobiota bacterium]
METIKDRFTIWFARSGLVVALLTTSATADPPPAPAISFDLGPATLAITTTNPTATLQFAGGTRWPGAGHPAFTLETDGARHQAETASWSGGRLSVRFGAEGHAEFQVIPGNGFVVFRLTRLEATRPVTRLGLFDLGAPRAGRMLDTLNGVIQDGQFAALMAATPNVHAFHRQAGGTQVDRAGCHHDFVPVTEAQEGRFAAQFTATCNEQANGWSMRGRQFAAPLDLTGCRALRAWVHGDGRGEALKIQLYDGAGGYRDNYVPIDFHGWRQVTLTNCPINSLRYDHVTTLNFYYNGLPAGTTVTCLVDHVEALVERDGVSRTVVLEDFEDSTSPLWSSDTINLCVQTERAHGIEPAAFGVLVGRETDFLETIRRFEVAAGLPSPQLGGVWNKQSPWTKQSYLFLTDFREAQFAAGLELARRGGFSTILFGQESWSHGTGHYEVNRDRFPDGLAGLQRTLQRFKDAGFRVGLHFLAASIYPPDSYLTPAPDPRLVKGASATLAAAVGATDKFLPLTTAPTNFPAEDGGYMGQGTVLQVGDELITYGKRALEPPFGFEDCQRGHLGTKATAHRQGEPVRHLTRAYGYHMFDMDTTLLEEVAKNFARVANTCGIDMIYFDGSEQLQGEHWYYNARLHQAFYDQLANKNTLLQASSFSHYSWHLLARSASADGHGDLKGYLDQRSGWFDSLARDGMPLDIGWYYGYDPTCTPDMFEYVLAATLGYDSSMSFQVSCQAATAHPFTGEILDLIARYEKLRRSGRVPEKIKAQLRIDPALTAIKPGDPDSPLLAKRHEYRLLEQSGRQYLQPVVYGAWHEIPAGATNAVWSVRVPDGFPQVGVQLHAQRDAEITNPVIRLGEQRWAWSGTLTNGQFLFFWPGEPTARHRAGLQPPERGPLAPATVLSPGEHQAAFMIRRPHETPCRVRFTFQGGKRLDL